MICKNCKSILQETDIYCHKCGSKISSNDPYTDGMEIFEVINSSSKSNTDTDSDIKGCFMFIGIILINAIMLVATWYATYGTIRACELINEGKIDWQVYAYTLLYAISAIIWQYINDLIFDWSSDVESYDFDNISFWSYVAIFIPTVPAVSRLYYSVQYETVHISMANICFYIITVVSCFLYYYFKKI